MAHKVALIADPHIFLDGSKNPIWTQVDELARRNGAEMTKLNDEDREWSKALAKSVKEVRTGDTRSYVLLSSQRNTIELTDALHDAITQDDSNRIQSCSIITGFEPRKNDVVEQYSPVGIGEVIKLSRAGLSKLRVDSKVPRMKTIDITTIHQHGVRKPQMDQLAQYDLAVRALASKKLISAPLESSKHWVRETELLRWLEEAIKLNQAV